MTHQVTKTPGVQEAAHKDASLCALLARARVTAAQPRPSHCGSSCILTMFDNVRNGWVQYSEMMPSLIAAIFLFLNNEGRVIAKAQVASRCLLCVNIVLSILNIIIHRSHVWSGDSWTQGRWFWAGTSRDTNHSGVTGTSGTRDAGCSF